MVVARRKEAFNVYFPDICRMSNGELVVVFYESPAHVSKFGRIAIVTSSDSGNSWSQSRVLIDTPLDDRDPSITQLSNGTLLINWFTLENDIPQVNIARSFDGGATWTEPVIIKTVFPGAACSDRVLELSNGDLLLPIYVSDFGGDFSMSAVIRSTDNGDKWQSPSLQIIGWDPKKKAHLSEPALVEIDNGVLLSVSRNENGASYESTSFDYGHTWTQAMPTNLLAHAPNMIRLPNRRIFLSFGDISGKYGPGRHVVSVTKSRDVEWESGQEELLYRSDGTYDATYPSSVLINDSLILTVFYDAIKGLILGRWSVVASQGIVDSVGLNRTSVLSQVPSDFVLHQNYPNPFNHITFIKYELPVPSFVELDIFDLQGRRISRLVDESQESGTHTVVWWWGGASGVYFCRVTASGNASDQLRVLAIKKMILVK